MQFSTILALFASAALVSAGPVAGGKGSYGGGNGGNGGSGGKGGSGQSSCTQGQEQACCDSPTGAAVLGEACTLDILSSECTQSVQCCEVTQEGALNLLALCVPVNVNL